MRVEESVEINRPVEEVFSYASDPEHFPGWSGIILEVQKEEPERYESRPSPLTSVVGGRLSLALLLSALQEVARGPSHRVRYPAHRVRGPRASGGRRVLHGVSQGLVGRRARSSAPVVEEDVWRIGRSKLGEVPAGRGVSSFPLAPHFQGPASEAGRGILPLRVRNRPGPSSAPSLRSSLLSTTP